MATKTSISRTLLVAGMLSFSCAAMAQDVVLKIGVKVGEDRPQVSEHRIAAGTEVAIHTGAVYRIMVKPMVTSATSVQLYFKVLDAASGATVSGPMITAQVGQKATYMYRSCPFDRQRCLAQGTDAPHPEDIPMDVTKSLDIDVTPSL